MKFSTIWTLPAATLSEKLRRTRDWSAQKVAQRLPVRIRYWTTVQMMADATIDESHIMATPLEVILKKIDAPKELA